MSDSDLRLVIRAANLNSLLRASIPRTIDKAHRAHHTDVIHRLNGQDVREECDWIKYLEIAP
jgi:hypothetical protein